jgi:hypothetical protein
LGELQSTCNTMCSKYSGALAFIIIIIFGLFHIVVAYCHWNRMPRSSSLTRELKSLPISGGVSGRKCRKEESPWNFNVDFCTSLVTPAENVRSSPLSNVEDEITDSDSKSSSEYSDLDSEV